MYLEVFISISGPVESVPPIDASKEARVFFAIAEFRALDGVPLMPECPCV